MVENGVEKSHIDRLVQAAAKVDEMSETPDSDATYDAYTNLVAEFYEVAQATTPAEVPVSRDEIPRLVNICLAWADTVGFIIEAEPTNLDLGTAIGKLKDTLAPLGTPSRERPMESDSDNRTTRIVILEAWVELARKTIAAEHIPVTTKAPGIQSAYSNTFANAATTHAQK